MGLYDAYSREELIQKLQAKDRLQKELLRHLQEEEKSEYAWSGNLGHWFWDYKEDQVTFNFLKAGLLGYKKKDLPETVPFSFFTDRMNPEDYKIVMEALKKHVEGKTPLWSVKYRIQANDGTWKTYYDQGEVTQRDEKGNTLFLTGIVFDITEEDSEKQELIEQTADLSVRAKTDGLTQLSNRTAIMYKLAKFTKEAKQSGESLFVVLLDIDHLKQQNEMYGPMLGDEILRKTGSLIQSYTHAYDAIGRYWGERFLMVLPKSDKEEAFEIANNIRLGLQRATFSQPAEATLSGSIVDYQGVGTLGQLIQMAEEKLYKAKNKGRNQIEL